MSWIAILLFVLEHIPDIVDIVKKIISLIHGLPREDRERAKAEFTTAIRSGDMQNVRDVASHWHRRCEPGTVGCPVDLVGG